VTQQGPTPPEGPRSGATPPQSLGSPGTSSASPGAPSTPGQRLDIGGVLTRVFETYRDQAGLFLPGAFIIFLPVAILSGLAQGSVASALVFGLVAGILNLIAIYAYQGFVAEAVRDIQDHVRDLDMGSLFRSVAPVIVPLFLASVLAGIGIFIGFVLIIVPGLVLIILERRGVIEAFGRSRELVRGNGWQVFAVIVVIALVQIIVSAVLSAIINVFAASVVGSAVATLLTSTLVAPIAAIAAAVMFLELRRLHGEADLPAGASGVSGATSASGLGRSPGGSPGGPMDHGPPGRGGPAEPGNPPSGGPPRP
jgi:hypothetical protein